MARHYVIQDWSNSATWSGEMIGDRLSKSEGHHFLKNGMANTKLYEGDEDTSKKTKAIPIADKILPQRKRVQTLTTQMHELVKDYKAGKMSIEEYSMLLAVVTAKRDRAVELLNKAKNTKPKRLDDEDTHAEAEQENVVFKGEKTAKQSQKKLESCVFLGACVLVSLVMLILSH